MRKTKPNPRIQHLAHLQREYGEIGYRGLLMHRNGHGKWIKIDPRIKHRCSIRLDNCSGKAYRLVHSRYGRRWTCDNCARQMCEESNEFIKTHSTARRAI